MKIYAGGMWLKRILEALIGRHSDDQGRERAKVKDHLVVLLLDERGNVKMRAEGHGGSIMGNGFHKVGACVASPTQPAPFKYVAIGTSGTAVATSQTSLGGEVARSEGTFTHDGKYKWSMDCTFGAGTGTGTIQEAGCFNSAADGTMLNRQTFTAIPKGASDTLKIMWDYTLS
ncbi:MAG: hypothetical protein ACXQTL_04865 [Methanosarcinales archaeon]